MLSPLHRMDDLRRFHHVTSTLYRPAGFECMGPSKQGVWQLARSKRTV
jgi:hypothetical protein